MGCNLRDLAKPHPISMNDLAGKKVGIDAFLVAFQFLATIRDRGPEGDGGPLKDDKGRPVSHLMGFLDRTTLLIEAGVEPIYIFDGAHPELKQDTIKQRSNRRKEAEKKWETALAEGDFKSAQKYAQQSLRYTPEMQSETKEMLDLLGVKWIDAAAEGEGQAAVMAAKGELDIVATQDWDAILYGTPVLVRNLMSAGSKRYGRTITAEMILLSEFLSENEITREQLIDMAIMIGTDFHPGIKGIGPKSALKLIKKCGTIEDIAKEKHFHVPEKLDEIRNIFLNHPAKDVESLSAGVVDENGLEEFLIKERGFSERRFERNMKRMQHRMRKKGQSSLEEFF